MKSRETSPASRRRVRARTGMTLLVVPALLAALGCKKEAAPPPPPPAVQLMDVTVTNVPLDAEIIGQLDSPQNVEIRARVEGFVDKMLFVEGTEVKEGDPLFVLDKKPFLEQLAAAKGMLGEAEAALKKYEADVNRLKPLAEKRAVPRQDLENAVAAVDVGKAAVISAQARVDSAQINLGYCDITAPITGLIGAKQVSIGELVGKGQPTLMATISTLDPIWFYCNVSEESLLRAEAEVRRTGRKIADAPVSLTLSDGSTHAAKGQIVFLDRAVDVKTGTLRMRAAFPNPDKLLRPGMFARMKVDLGTRPDSILVPERAVTSLQGKNFVWVIDSDNKATQRGVIVGQQVGDSLLVREGLKAGERIVLEGIQKVRDGVVVQPMTAAQMAEAAQQAKTAPAKSHEAKQDKK